MKIDSKMKRKKGKGKREEGLEMTRW